MIRQRTLRAFDTRRHEDEFYGGDEARDVHKTVVSALRDWSLAA
jgi:hypothetical protein